MNSRVTSTTHRHALLAALTVLALALLAAVPSPAVLAAPARAAAAEPRPNFVVLFLDDMRVDELAAMPFTRKVVAAKGATFANAYSTFPLCCPARATILTGQYAHNHGVRTNVPPNGGVEVFDERHTIAPWLRRNGYTTGYVGKYLNGYGVQTTKTHVPRGWDVWQVLAKSPMNYLYYTLNSNGRLRDYRGAYQTTVTGAKAAGFIRRHAGRKPFMLVTSFLAPHVGRPFEPADPTGWTPAVTRKYVDTQQGSTMPRPASFNEADVSDKPGVISNRAALTADDEAFVQELYEQRRESIASVDDEVRRIVRALADERQLRRTYILVTSDNGYLLGEHRVPQGKILPYEPSARVPMILRGPGVSPGVRVRQLAGLHDIAPTMLRATGTYGAQTVALDGRNLLALARNPKAAARRDLVLEAGSRETEQGEGVLTGSGPGWFYRGLRTNTGWKYVEYDTGEVEMYDLRTDPDELVNLVHDPAYDARQARLHEALKDVADCAGHACTVDVVR